MVIWIEGGGGIDNDILLLTIVDNVLIEGHSGEGNKEQWLNRICLKDMRMSVRIDGEEDPKVQEVYEVHIVQRYVEKIRWAMCFILLDNEEDIIEEGEEEGIRRWQMWEVREKRVVAIWQLAKRWGIVLLVVGHQGQNEEWGEMLAMEMPMGSEWCDIFHNRSCIFLG